MAEGFSNINVPDPNKLKPFIESVTGSVMSIMEVRSTMTIFCIFTAFEKNVIQSITLWNSSKITYYILYVLLNILISQTWKNFLKRLEDYSIDLKGFCELSTLD
jgi:hypothetical protein